MGDRIYVGAARSAVDLICASSSLLIHLPACQSRGQVMHQNTCEDRIRVTATQQNEKYRSRPSFGYLADPVCIASLLIYVANRWYLKPHHIGGWFTRGYLNDVLCLPLLLPMILRVQRLIGLRNHDDFPTAWEVLQHWAIFSIVFELIIPRFPSRFDSTADPWDVLAYLAGGTLAWIWWSGRSETFSCRSRLAELVRQRLAMCRRENSFGQGPHHRMQAPRSAARRSR